MKCLVYFTITFLFCGFEARQIPDYIHKCKRNDPAVTKCIKESVEALRSRLKDGIEELDVPSLEPFKIDEVEISRGDGPTNFRTVLHDIFVTGASNFEITKLKLDIPNLIYRVGIKIPFLKLDGDYDVNARVLVVPIKGKGKFVANATNVEGHAIIKGELKNDNGKKLMDFTEFTLKLNIGNYKIHLDNLFEGDPVLSQAANDVLNENRGDFIVIATPFIEQKASEILLDIAKKIVKNVEYDDAFPAE